MADKKPGENGEAVKRPSWPAVAMVAHDVFILVALCLTVWSMLWNQSEAKVLPSPFPWASNEPVTVEGLAHFVAWFFNMFMASMIGAYRIFLFPRLIQWIRIGVGQERETHG